MKTSDIHRVFEKKIGIGPKKKPQEKCFLGFSNKCLAVTYSHTANAALPSALVRFTSEFGMGSGGSIPLLPPGKLKTKHIAKSVQERLV